jgi:hypothetical protein
MSMQHETPGGTSEAAFHNEATSNNLLAYIRLYVPAQQTFSQDGIQAPSLAVSLYK